MLATTFRDDGLHLVLHIVCLLGKRGGGLTSCRLLEIDLEYLLLLLEIIFLCREEYDEELLPLEEKKLH